ncbi:MAG: TetR/AcrR family transcriptional regulator [Mycobacterium kyogaense]|uniref:TetR/AcrR family transcriptional regulator n=1 Tax=Mycobacterium kyogaense TaxID=2212479 RepID=UPI002FF647A6
MGDNIEVPTKQPGSQSGSRSERKSQRTRRMLLDSGRSLVAAKGVAKLRIQDVTESADVALGSFYNYFDSKEAFLEAIFTESLQELAATVVTDEKESVDPAEVVALGCLRIIDLANVDPDFARLVANIGHSDALFGRALHPYARVAIERGLESGRFVTPDISVLLTSVIGGAFALIREILESRLDTHPERAFAQQVLSSMGLAPADAAAVVDKVVRAEQNPQD